MNGKKVLNMDRWQLGELAWLPCCWSDCEKSGTTLYQSWFHEHNPGIPCDHPELGKHVWYVFCNEKHRQFFKASHQDGHGRLPVGERGRIG